MFSIAAFHFQMLGLGPLMFCRAEKLKAGLLSLEVLNPCRNSTKQGAAVLVAFSNKTKPQSQMRSGVWCEVGRRSSSLSCSVRLQPGAAAVPRAHSWCWFAALRCVGSGPAVFVWSVCYLFAPFRQLLLGSLWAAPALVPMPGRSAQLCGSVCSTSSRTTDLQ